MIDIIAHRCGRPTKNAMPCRTPVVYAGGVCGNHRPATPTVPATAQDHVTVFLDAYTCPGCDADVQLFTAGPAQLIVVGHDSACPQIVERVKRGAAE